MATYEYMNNRKTNRPRPQGLLFANNPGTLTNGFYVPEGDEFEDFIILSDDNRGEIGFKQERIETKKRMINGRMRSYFIADKISIDVSWQRLPSRAFAYGGEDSINSNGTISSEVLSMQESYTTDGGAGGVELLKWYKEHPGSFWVYLAYDNYDNFSGEEKFNNLNRYNEIIEVFFDSFDHSVEKRGGTNFDFWDVSLNLEEV